MRKEWLTMSKLIDQEDACYVVDSPDGEVFVHPRVENASATACDIAKRTGVAPTIVVMTSDAANKLAGNA